MIKYYFRWDYGDYFLSVWTRSCHYNEIEFWSIVESRCSRQCVFIAIEVFCRVLVCVVYWLWVLPCSAMSGCLRLWPAVREGIAIESVKQIGLLSRDRLQMKDIFLRSKSFQIRSFGVQLHWRSWKHCHVTILSNQVSETTYLIFAWFVLKFVFLWFWSALCFCVFSHICSFAMGCRISSSSSSSCRVAGTDIPDPLSPHFPIVHRLWQVFWTTSRILT